MRLNISNEPDHASKGQVNEVAAINRISETNETREHCEVGCI